MNARTTTSFSRSSPAFRPRGAAHAIAARWFSCGNAADALPIVAEAAWEGRIGFERRGTGGFGYDPLFVVPAANFTVAEMPEAEKNRVSHRGQALAALADEDEGSRLVSGAVVSARS